MEAITPAPAQLLQEKETTSLKLTCAKKRKDVVEAPTVSYPSGHPLEGTTVSRNETGKIFYVRFFKGTY